MIDVQNSFLQRPTWPAISNPDIVDDVTALVGAARAKGDLVVWVLHTEPGSGGAFDPESGHVELMDGLETREGEPVVRKTSINAFTSTNLQQLLTRHGVTHLDICGIQTEQCCETTTRVASDLGYDVGFVIDATATFPIQHRDAKKDRPLEEILADPQTRPTDEVVRGTEYSLAGRFATIRTVAELV
ncbi:isochorismatase [Luteipulveratus mongoliensis]|uniref:Isochorismatase n=1 Tax=Luteipulveratus mongoliensis TaxID=571913 RepID=A0A0K1JQT0_9MICO|nr:isochorismatase [Luteipulveratus mongoliensis]